MKKLKINHLIEIIVVFSQLAPTQRFLPFLLKEVLLGYHLKYIY